MERTVIGLVGMPGSRKTAFADALVPLGWEKLTMSDILEARLRARGASLLPPEYREEAAALRRERGPAALAAVAFESTRADRIVVDGLRCLPEAVWFSEHARFLLVAVQAAAPARARRLASYPHGFYTGFADRAAELDAHELVLGVGNLVALADAIVTVEDPVAPDLRAKLAEHAPAIHARALAAPRSGYLSEIARRLGASP